MPPDWTTSGYTPDFSCIDSSGEHQSLTTLILESVTARIRNHSKSSTIGQIYNELPDNHKGSCSIVMADTKQAKASIKDWCLSSKRMHGANSSPLIVNVIKVATFVINPVKKEEKKNELFS